MQRKRRRPIRGWRREWYDSKTVALTNRQERYTMLVAWHKFDQYERIQLAQVTITDITRLPFSPVRDVIRALIEYDARYLYSKNSRHPYPIKDYVKRIARAARKVDNKRRQRIRV